MACGGGWGVVVVVGSGSFHAGSRREEGTSDADALCMAFSVREVNPPPAITMPVPNNPMAVMPMKRRSSLLLLVRQ